LAESTEAYPALSVDVVWALLATRRLFTDLTATSLMRHDHVALFGSEAAGVQAARTAAGAVPLWLLWDHRLWQVDVHGDAVLLRPEVGEAVQLSAAQVQDLLERGALQPRTVATPSPMTPEIREALTRASPTAQRAANERLRQILTEEEFFAKPDA
jgi:putative transposase